MLYERIVISFLSTISLIITINSVVTFIVYFGIDLGAIHSPAGKSHRFLFPQKFARLPSRCNIPREEQ